MRKAISLTALVLGLAVCRAAQAQTPTSPIPQATWQPQASMTPLWINNGLHSMAQGMTQMWSRISPFPAQPQSFYPTYPTQSQMPGMSYLQQFGYQVATPAQ
jgi:hypothetical protein